MVKYWSKGHAVLLKCPLSSAKNLRVFQSMLRLFHLAEPKIFSLRS